MEKGVLQFAKKVRKKFPALERSRKTGVKPRLKRLQGVKLVLVDLYGTVFIAHQVTKSRQHRIRKMQGMREAIKMLGLQDCLKKIGKGESPPQMLGRVVREEIEKDHERKRARGAKNPEVKIEKIWESVLGKVYRQCGRKKPKQFALAAKKACYLAEWLHEPTGIYAGFMEAAERLKERGVLLGVASNSQFNTKINLDFALQEKSNGKVRKWQQLFEPGLSEFSFETGESKPSERFFSKILRNAKKRGIKRREIVFVGNDVLRDVKNQAKLGFRTVLFAGDEKSLRLRKGDKRVRGVKADAVITDWRQLLKVVG